MPKKTLIIVWTTAFLLSVALSAFAGMESDGYYMDGLVMTNSGGTMASGSSQMNATLGQSTPVGVLTGSSNILDAGFWIIAVNATPPSGSVSINNGSTYTNQTDVTLTLSASDTNGLSQMQFSNDDTIYSEPEDYAVSKSWTLLPGDGTKTVYVRFQDGLGNWSPVYTDTITLDQSPPEAPEVNGTTPTNDMPTWSWVSRGGGIGTYRYKLNNDNLDTGATVTTATTYTPPSLDDGTYTLYVQERDAAGNWSSLDGSFGSFTIVFDTAAPSAPSNLDLATADDSGIADDDNITQNTFNLTITGAGENGAVIQLYDNENPIPGATATVTGGTFSIDISLSQATHSIKAIQADPSGNISALSDALVIIIDTSSPAKPTGLDLAENDDSGISNSDKITNQTTNLTISGTGENGARVQLYDGSSLIPGATATVAGGVFSIDISLSEAIHNITAVQTDTAGNVSPASGVLTITVDATASNAPTNLDLAAEDDTGISNSDNLTNQTTNLTISGTGENGARVQLYDGSSPIPGATATVAGGVFSIDISLSEAIHNITAVQTDTAGNVSFASGVLTITVDATASNAPTNLDLAAEDDTGNNTDNITGKGTNLTISGSGENGSLIQLYDGGDPISGATSTVAGSVFSIDISLSEGSHNISATQTDAGNNTSEQSSPLQITVDTQVSAPAGLELAADDDKGSSSSDNLTNQTGNLTISGSGENSATVQLYDGTNQMEGAAGTVSGGIFSIDISLDEGSHSITAVQTDKAGNVSSASGSLEVVIDVTVPSVSITTPQNGSSVDKLWLIEGISSDSNDIHNVLLQITDGTWHLSEAGIFILTPVWIAVDGTTSWQKITSGVNWSIDTSYTIKAQAEDTAGNTATKTISFRYGIQAQPSTISCELSTNNITLGESLQVSGQISPGLSESGAVVDIAFKPETGTTIHEPAFANVEGKFSLDLECGLLRSAGLWRLSASWSGDKGLEPATSSEQTLEIAKAESRITLNLTSQAIKLGEPVSISGKFTPQPDCGGGLSGLPVTLFISGPGGAQAILPVTTNDQWGHFLLENYSGFNQLGDWTVTASFAGNEGYLAANSDPVQVRVVETAGYAIIVQGKISNEEGLASHNKTTQFVYNKLKDRGLLDDDIKYFYYDTNQPTKTAIENAITVWARDKMDPGFTNPDPSPEIVGKPANLYIVMVDHGLEDKFYIDPGIITSSDLANWLNTLQANLTGQAKDQEIIIILGFCHSGSFINDLSGNKRVIITSAAPGESSYKGPLDEDGIREGEYFITEFFKGVSFGRSIKESFGEAVLRTEAFTDSGSLSSNSANAPYYDKALQHPLLDDDGDGIGSNELSDPTGDGALSDELFIGVSSLTGNAPGDVYVEDVANTVFLDYGVNSVNLWATVNDDTRLGTIWVEVKSPDYAIIAPSSSGQVAMDLPKTIGIYNESTHRYEWNDLGGFTDPGMYQVFYFAKDDISGNVSPLMETRVYKQQPVQENTAPDAFSLILPDNDAVELTTILLDWEDTIDPEGHQLTYTVLLSKNDPTFSNPIRKEGLLNSTCLVSVDDGIEDLGTYYWKVLAIDEYGAIEESDTRVFHTNNTNPVWPGWISGHVYNTVTGQPIAGAVVSVGEVELATALGGYYLGTVPAGIYTVTAISGEFQSKSYTGVVIPSAGLPPVTKDFGLEPLIQVKKGDINNDTYINLSDAILLLQVLAGKSSTPVYKEADVNGDQKIGLEEVVYILQGVSELRQ